MFITIGLLPAVITLIGGVIAIIRGEDGAVANLIGGLAVSIVWMIPIGIILPLKVFGSRTNTVNLIVEDIGKNNIITAKKDCLILFAQINGTTVALREAYLFSKEI